MKFSFLLTMGLIASSGAFADFIHMKEDAKGKTVILHVDGKAPEVISSSNAWALYPDISANSEEVIFCEGTEQTDLSLTYINKRKNLTQKFRHPHKGMVLHPKFSKNGRWIFYSAPDAAGKNVIWYFEREALVKSQGESQEYTLTNAKKLSDEEAYFPRPSSDGNFVVYQRNTQGKKEIVLFDRIQDKKTVLAEGMSPALSFDERLVAFTSKVDGNWNVFVLDRVTKEVTRKTNDLRDEMAPTFRPDNTLVFASNKTNHFHLYELTGNQWKALSDVSQDGVDYYAPQYSGETGFRQGVLAPVIGTPRSSFGTVSHEGRIYMAGGHQGAEHTYPEESFTDAFVAYDIATNTWTELAPRPRKAHGYQIAAFGNYIYAFGGFAFSKNHKPKWKSLDEIDRYDIRTNTWETVGRLNVPRSSNVAVTIDEKVYLVGGWDSTPKKENDLEGTFLETIEVFDLRSEKLATASYKIPRPLRRAFTGIAHNGKILLIGGLGEGSSHFELLSRVTEIDPLTGAATELTPLPFATFAPAAEILNNELFVFGGMFKTGPMDYDYVAHIYGMDLSQKTWRHTGRFLRETKGFSQVFKLDHKTLGILGGHHYFQGMDAPVTTFETFR